MVSWADERRVTCPRCFDQVPPRRLKYRTADGEDPKLGDQFRRVSWLDYVKGVALGEPDFHHQRDPRFAAEQRRWGVQARCPADHVIPDALVDLPTITVALVGEKSSGKSLFLAAMVNELVFKDGLRDIGIGGRLDESCRESFAERYGPFLDNALQIVANEGSTDEGVASAPVLLTITRDGVGSLNLLLYDVDGSQLLSAADRGRYQRQVFAADVMIFFTPAPVFSAPFTGGRRLADDHPTLTNTVSLVQGAIEDRRAVSPDGRGLLGITLVTKADRVRPDFYQNHGDLCTDLDLTGQTFGLTAQNIRMDSADIRELVRAAKGGAVISAVEDYFEHQSFHFVTCVDGQLDGNRFIHGVQAQRVLDPIIAILDRSELA